MCELADLTAEWFDRAGPHGWNDPDLLEANNVQSSNATCRSSNPDLLTMYKVVRLEVTTLHIARPLLCTLLDHYFAHC